MRRKSGFSDGRGWGRGGGGAKTYDGEKAWSSINEAILSARALLATEGRKDPQLVFKANMKAREMRILPTFTAFLKVLVVSITTYFSHPVFQYLF